MTGSDKIGTRKNGNFHEKSICYSKESMTLSTSPIAALPMYDWPETRAETDALWAAIRHALEEARIAAPAGLVRSNAEMPPVPGGIRDAGGTVIAPDPAQLAPEELDRAALWRHPDLLFAQTCWGPMANGLESEVKVIGQPLYDDVEGWEGALYSSVVLARAEGGGQVRASHLPAPVDGTAVLDVAAMRGRRLAFNERHSMSGHIALSEDLAARGAAIEALFAEFVETGGHRASIVAVAQGEADICAVDCRSWALARRHEPAAERLCVIGWTARRPGLPYICSRLVDEDRVASMRAGLRKAGLVT